MKVHDRMSTGGNTKTIHVVKVWDAPGTIHKGRIRPICWTLHKDGEMTVVSHEKIAPVTCTRCLAKVQS